MGQDLKSDLYKHLEASRTGSQKITRTPAVVETREAPAHPQTISSTPKEHV